MENLLKNFYTVQIKEKMIIDGKTGFKNDEYVYFTTTAENNKAIHMEQATLAYHLVELGYSNMAIPIPNIYGEWITSYKGAAYIVFRVSKFDQLEKNMHGMLLVSFHRSNTTYEFEPQSISSYGKWPMLWIEKLTHLEKKIFEEANEHPNTYYSLLLDILPYLIGISENAIQYIRESEQEIRYDRGDQGTVVFDRYNNQLLKPVIWPNELRFDHPSRDVAEHIRNHLIRKKSNKYEAVTLFIKEYEAIQPLSNFNRRLLYGRLLFPIHFFDLIERGFTIDDFDQQFNELTNLVENQAEYEKRLKHLFEEKGLKGKKFSIPMLQWL